MSKTTFFGLLSNNPDRPLHYRFLKRQRHRANNWIAGSSKIPNDPILRAQDFDWTKETAENWADIRDEAFTIFRHQSSVPPLREVSPDHRGIVQDNSWRSFFLIGYGHRIEGNIARAPKTFELVSRIPGLNSAFFSFLAPGAVITPHRGVTKAFITAHLGLSIPAQRDKCWMRVDDQRVLWRNGEWLIFDDTYQHEVRNETDETRIILLCQVERPLSAPGSWVASAFMNYVKGSGFVREARDNIVEWEQAFAKAERDEL